LCRVIDFVDGKQYSCKCIQSIVQNVSLISLDISYIYDSTFFLYERFE